MDRLRGCIQTEYITGLIEWFLLRKRIGGWGPSFNVSRWSLQETLTLAHSYKLNLLFSWDVMEDPKNTTRKVIGVSACAAARELRLMRYQQEQEQESIEGFLDHC